MSEERWRQFRLGRGNERQVSWLPDDKRLKVGSRVELKGEDGPPWTILARSAVVLDHKPEFDWKVGGLV